MDDAACGAARAHRTQVDAEFPGAPAHGRRGDRAIGGAGRRHGGWCGDRCRDRRGGRRLRLHRRRRASGRRSERRRRSENGGRRQPRRIRCRGCCRAGRGGRRAGRVRGAGFGLFDAQQLAAHGQRAPDLAAEREHAAGHRRRDLDVGLVGHDVGHRLVLGHLVARRHMPGHELDLGDALADVGHLDDAHAHLRPPSCAAARRPRAPGRESRPIRARAGTVCPSR